MVTHLLSLALSLGQISSIIDEMRAVLSLTLSPLLYSRKITQTLDYCYSQVGQFSVEF